MNLHSRTVLSRLADGPWNVLDLGVQVPGCGIQSVLQEKYSDVDCFRIPYSVTLVLHLCSDGSVIELVLYISTGFEGCQNSIMVQKG